MCTLARQIIGFVFVLATGHFGRTGWSELPERSLRSRRTLTEVLFALHFIQDATALHSAQMHPELAEGELPFTIFENCPVAKLNL